MDRIGGVETETIEVEFVHPVTAVADVKLANWLRIRSVEINGVAPVGFLFADEVIVRINRQVISVRSEMVVNDIQNDGQA